MSLLKKFFGQRDPLTQTRQFSAQGNWAAAFIEVKKIDRATLSPQELEEVAALEVRAGDKLAELNLAEGEGEMQNGNLLRAREHFQLACEQAQSPELVRQVDASLAGLEQGNAGRRQSAPVGQPAADSGGCGPACGPHGRVAAAYAGDDLDEETHFEVLLATLPEPLAKRYLAAGDAFRRAWLASHQEDPRPALELLEEVPEAERDGLFYSERGSLRGRSRDLQGALADLRRAMTDEPDLFTAMNATVDLLVGSGQHDEAERLLRKTLAEQRFPGYCRATLAQLLAHRGQEDDALELAGQALGDGYADPAAVQLCAAILEKKERFSEAEAMLAKLPGGGCSGGGHPLLAEFWLRREKNLDKALEMFKGALLQEPGNLLWRLRIAQTYMARGWKSEAAEQLDRLLAHDDLTRELRSEVQTAADQLRQA